MLISPQRDPDSLQHLLVNAGQEVPWHDQGPPQPQYFSLRTRNPLKVF